MICKGNAVGVPMRHGPAPRHLSLAMVMLVTFGAVHHGAARASTALDAVQVQCTLQPTQLHFGTLSLHRADRVPGKGEILVACQNPSTTVQRVDLSVAQMALTPGTVTLAFKQGGLRADFFLDAQGTVPWGDGTHGTRTLQLRVRLDPGAYQLLRLPVHALLHNRADAPPGAYLGQVPLTLTLSSPD